MIHSLRQVTTVCDYEIWRESFVQSLADCSFIQLLLKYHQISMTT